MGGRRGDAEGTAQRCRQQQLQQRPHAHAHTYTRTHERTHTSRTHCLLAWAEKLSSMSTPTNRAKHSGLGLSPVTGYTSAAKAAGKSAPTGSSAASLDTR